MKPRDLLLWRIQEFILPIMEDKNFTFAKSKLYFRRRLGDFSQVVMFHSSYKNDEDYCSFQTGWDVESGIYQNWYQETWGESSGLGKTILATIDNGIPGWRQICEPQPPRRFWQLFRRPRRMPLGYNLRNSPRDEVIMRMLQDAFTNVGIPFLDHMSAWRTAAEWYKDNLFYWHHVCDLYMIAGEVEEARSFLDKSFEAARGSDNPNAHWVAQELELRRIMFFGT